MLEMVTDKISHVTHMLGAATTGLVAESLVSSFDPSQVVSAVQIISQCVIALVTVFATLKKAFQKPVVAIIAPAQDVPTINSAAE